MKLTKKKVCINRSSRDQIRESNKSEQTKPNRGFVSRDQVSFDTGSSRNGLCQDLEARNVYWEYRGGRRRGNPRSRGRMGWGRGEGRRELTQHENGGVQCHGGETRRGTDGEAAAARGRREGGRLLLRRRSFKTEGLFSFGF
jgi:hypothetical protein